MGGKSGKFPMRVSVLIVLVIVVAYSGASQGSIIQSQGQDEGLTHNRSITNSIRGHYLKFIKNSGNKFILKASQGDLQDKKTTSTTEATTTTSESTTTTAEATSTTTTTEEPTTTSTTEPASTTTTSTTPSTTSSATSTTSTAPTTTTTTSTAPTTTTTTPKSTTTSTTPKSTTTTSTTPSTTSTPSPCPAPKTPSDKWSWKAFFVGMLVTGSLMASSYFAWKLYNSGIRFPSYQRV